MTLKDVLGYLFCAGGIGLAIATWWASLGWGWGVTAVALFLIGWYFLRSERRDVAESIGDAVDVISDLDFD